MTVMTSRESLAELTFQVERFYYDEAALIEKAEYTAWLELLDADIVYRVPQPEFADRRTNRQLDDIGANLFDDDRRSIERRINWLLAGPTPETPRPFRRMLITNVRVLNDAGQEIEVESSFLQWELPSSGRGQTLIGGRSDVLRKVPDGFRILRRTVMLDGPVLTKAPMSFF